MPKPAAPATVSNAVKETDLTTVTLSAKAVERLGIQTKAVELQSVDHSQVWPGELVIPPGQILTVAAPLAGTLVSGGEEAWPAPGEAVRAGQILAHLKPAFLNQGQREVLPPSDRLSSLKLRADLSAALADADGEITRLEVQVEAARTKEKRAKELLDEDVGSERSHDEARAELESAEASLLAARERKSALKSIEVDSLPEELIPLQITSPIDGLLRDIQVGIGEAVAAGASLFQVMNVDRLWVRVPVYAGDQASVTAAEQASVSRINGGLSTSSRAALRVTAPPTATALSDTVDMYFEFDNTDGAFRPGERVQVTIGVGATTEKPVMPWSAVVHDVDGGTWTYINGEPNTYVRRRVEIERVVGELAVIRRGLTPGTPVVVAGAAELYGTEFGVGK